MNIKQSPNSYCSVINEAIFRIEDIDPKAVTEVEIYRADKNVLLGVKRYTGHVSIAVNVAAYVRNVIKAEPSQSQECRFKNNIKRTAMIYIKIGKMVSATAILTLAETEPKRGKLLSDAPEKQNVDWKAVDEMAFICERQTVAKATAVVSDGTKERVIDLCEHMQDDGIATLEIVMQDISRRIGDQTDIEVKKVKQVHVMISINGQHKFEKRYIISDAMSQGIGICWKNIYGTIDYYMLASESSKERVVEKKIIYTNRGYKTLQTQSECLSTLVSQYEPEKIMEWLAGVVWSPCVWIIKNDKCIPVDVISSKMTQKKLNMPSRLEMTVRPMLRNGMQNV